MSRTQRLEAPDFINIDLDLSDDDFKKVIETAYATKEILSKYKIKSFVKTSGKTSKKNCSRLRGKLRKSSIGLR